MTVKPTVVLRGVLVGGVAIFAKVAGALKAAGGVKLGAAASAMTVAATAAVQNMIKSKKIMFLLSQNLLNEYIVSYIYM
ncbi:unnamed protein product [Cochlearia groenlandica]